MSLINNGYFLKKIIFVFLIIKEKFKDSKTQDFENAKTFLYSNFLFKISKIWI